MSSLYEYHIQTHRNVVINNNKTDVFYQLTWNGIGKMCINAMFGTIELFTTRVTSAFYSSNGRQWEGRNSVFQQLLVRLIIMKWTDKITAIFICLVINYTVNINDNFNLANDHGIRRIRTTTSKSTQNDLLKMTYHMLYLPLFVFFILQELDLCSTYFQVFYFEGYIVMLSTSCCSHIHNICSSSMFSHSNSFLGVCAVSWCAFIHHLLTTARNIATNLIVTCRNMVNKQINKY